MAAQRRSAREIEARRRARERTAALREREQQLEDLATVYFLAGGEVHDVELRAETRLRESAERVELETRAAIEPLRARQAAAVRKMLALTRIGAVAERLGEPRDSIAQFRAPGAQRPTALAAAEDTGLTAVPGRDDQPVQSPGRADEAPHSVPEGTFGTS